MKSRFGLHIRLHDSLFDAVDKVHRLDQKIFQTVLMLQSRKFLNMSDDDMQKFVEFRTTYCDELFVHGAYWSNITNIGGRGFYSLQKEIELAEKLAFTHIVIHPGSFETKMTQEERIEYIARAVDILVTGSSKIIILLENSPHKDKSFTSDIEEFGQLFKKIKNTDRVKMCVDTAHAYVAGYDIATPKKVEEFVKLLVDSVGQKNIGLLHCNDTKKKCGSFLDEHAVPGYGNIGVASLYHFVHHPLLAKIPVIFELPAIDESLEHEILQQFNDMETLK